jgi:hypothetical protein
MTLVISPTTISIGFSALGLIQGRQKRLGSDGSIGLSAHRANLAPVHVTVEPNADLPSAPDVGRLEEPVRLLGHELPLGAWWRCAPQVRKVVDMVAARPHHDELLLHEEGRRTVAEAFGDAGQRQAERPDLCLHLIPRHRSAP